MGCTHGIDQTQTLSYLDGAIELDVSYNTQIVSDSPKFTSIDVTPIQLHGEPVVDYQCHILDSTEEMNWFYFQEEQLIADINGNSDKYMLKVHTMNETSVNSL